MTPALYGPAALLAIASCLLLWSSVLASEPLRIFAVGDVPYSRAEADLLDRLLRDVAAAGPSLLLHVGDIKGGGQPCTDEGLRAVAALFRRQAAPVLYTPGDNEWTDCHRASAGGHDPVHRLAALRRVFFADPGVLHLGRLSVRVPDRRYPENLYFVRDDVLFALVHVVGSDNGLRPDDAAAVAEHRERSAANRQLLRRAARLAEERDVGAIVLAFHANPRFDDRRSPGFAPFKRDLRELLQAFGGPVLLIHGDTHQYRFDRPVKDDTGRTISRVQRLEVPGSPRVAGVWVTIDPQARPVFDAQPAFPDALDQWRAEP
jgi:hypothetical protein